MKPIPQNSHKLAPMTTQENGSTQNANTVTSHFNPAPTTDSVTLRNLAPSLFSPPSFETTAVHRFPQTTTESDPTTCNNNNNNEQKFMVSSTSPLTMKHHQNAAASSSGVAPFTLANATNPRFHPAPSSTNPRLYALNQNSNSTALLAALNGGNSSMAFGSGHLGGNNNDNSNSNNITDTCNGSALWFLP